METPREKLNLQGRQRILCVFGPMPIHPRWEIAVAGRPIESCDWASLPALKKALLWKSYGQFCRDNPRSLRYMSDRAMEQLAESDAVIDALMPEGSPEQLDAGLRTRIRETFPLQVGNKIERTTRQLLKSQPYDLVLLFFPDAIGYGWGAAEKALAKLKAPLWVVNGRRRVFPLNPRFRRKLRLRRLIEASWLVETIFVLSLACIGLGLALWDIPRKWFHHER
jgi:hypothetical protein